MATEVTILSGENFGGIYTTPNSITWNDLSSSPFGTWSSYPSWRIQSGSQVSIQLDDDLSTVDRRIPELTLEIDGDLTLQLKISETGTFTGEETTINFAFETPVNYPRGRYYRWTITVSINSSVTEPYIYSFNTLYRTDRITEYINDQEVYANVDSDGDLSLTTNLGLVLNIQATAHIGNPYVVADYIEPTGTVYSLGTAIPVTNYNVTYNTTDPRYASSAVYSGADGNPLVSSGSYSIFSYQAALNLNPAQDQTWEFSVRVPTGSTGIAIHQGLYTNSSTREDIMTFEVAYDSAGALSFTWITNLDSGNSVTVDGLLPDIWYHVAITRNSTTRAMVMYINGVASAVSIGSGSALTPSTNYNLIVGGYNNNGIVANIGTAIEFEQVRFSASLVYTTNFTAPAFLTRIGSSFLYIVGTDPVADEAVGDYGSDPYIIDQQSGIPTIQSKNPPMIRILDPAGNFWDGTVDVVLTGYPTIQLSDGGVFATAN